MIYVTGDTHGQHDFGKLQFFARQNPALSREDSVIVAGDFGGVWSAKTLDADLKPYEELPFTVLFIDGNHENFDLLNAYPVEEWKGGKIHRIRPNIIHLMRGQVFVIEGKKIFTFGGASSVDREMRTEGVSWWAAEVPDYAEFDEGIANLKRHDNTVDYIITHTADERAMYYPAMVRMLARKEVRPENRMLSAFEDTVTYRHWYFGHYHIDASVNAIFVLAERRFDLSVVLCFIVCSLCSGNTVICLVIIYFACARVARKRFVLFR